MGGTVKVPDLWRPTKYTVSRSGTTLSASRDQQELASSSRLVAARVAQFYAETVPKYARGRLLDLGCGKAPLLAWYAPHVSDATLVDWAGSLHPNPLLNIVADLNEPLNLADESFDTVILSDVLEHIAEPSRLLGEISRVMTPDGTLLMNVPFYYPLHEEPFDYMRYTRHALARMSDKAGLGVVEIRSIGGAPEVLADVSSKLLGGLGIVGRPLAIFLQAVTLWITSFGPGRRLSARTASRFPLGYVLVARKSRMAY